MTAAPSSWPLDPTRAALVLDFDGTLAPIVADPTTSRMPDATAAALADLVGRLRTVAVVSGRPAGFLAERVTIPGIRLFGLYGLERVVDGQVVPDDRVAAHEGAVQEAHAALEAMAADWPGAFVEDKGRGLAMHWRRAEDPAGAAADLAPRVREVGERLGLWAEDGKQVVELRPPVEVDKGAVVREIAGDDAGSSEVAEVAEVAFAGDDVGDLSAFAATAALDGLCIAVDHGEETDQAVREAGDLVVDGTEGMAEWLTALAARLA